MNAREKTTKSGDESEKSDKKIKDGGEFRLDVITGEENGRAGEDEGKEDVGRGVGGFKSTVDEDRAVIDDKKFFEEDVDSGDGEINKSEEFQLAVDLFETFATDELNDAEDDEVDGGSKESSDGKVGDFIPSWVDALVVVGEQIADGFIETGETDGRIF